MPNLPPTSAARRGVFTSREAAGTGWTISALKYAVRHTGELERLRRGCFAPPPGPHLSEHEVADLRLVRAAVAASLCARDVAVSHLASALLRDLPTWASDPHACVTTHRDIQLDGIHTHRALARPGHVERIGDVPVTALERTIVDIAREFGPEAGLVVADAAAHRSLITLGDLDAAIEQLGRHLDVEPARVVLDDVDPAAESPLESRSRWHIALHDLPPPLTQVEIHTRSGQFLGRTDFFWYPGVVGEVDGAAKYETKQDLRREKWRQEQIEDVDLPVARWGSVQLRDFGPTAARIRRGLARAAAFDGERAWVAVPTH